MAFFQRLFLKRTRAVDAPERSTELECGPDEELFCRQCDRTTVTRMEAGRFWCSWCGDWTQPRRRKKGWTALPVPPSKTIIVGKNAIGVGELAGLPAAINALADEIKQRRQVPWLIQLLVHGYNQDPRPLPEIPEVVKWYASLSVAYSYLPYLLDVDSILVYFRTLASNSRSFVETGLVTDLGPVYAALLLEIYSSGNRFFHSLFPSDAETASRLASEATDRIRRALQL